MLYMIAFYLAKFLKDSCIASSLKMPLSPRLPSHYFTPLQGCTVFFSVLSDFLSLKADWWIFNMQCFFMAVWPNFNQFYCLLIRLTCNVQYKMLYFFYLEAIHSYICISLGWRDCRCLNNINLRKVCLCPLLSFAVCFSVLLSTWLVV